MFPLDGYNYVMLFHPAETFKERRPFYYWVERGGWDELLMYGSVLDRQK